MIPPSVELQSIEFKNLSGQISSVQCTYSDKKQSPVFEKVGENSQQQEVIYFGDSIKRVKKILLGSSNQSAYNQEASCVTTVKFLDQDNNTIGAYNPRNYCHEEKQIVLHENEEIIGVYGLKDKKFSFSTFGFMLRVKRY